MIDHIRVCAKRIHSNFEHNSEKCTPAFCQTLHSVVAKSVLFPIFLSFFEAATFGLICSQI